jgi:hypothetical protein
MLPLPLYLIGRILFVCSITHCRRRLTWLLDGEEPIESLRNMPGSRTEPDQTSVRDVAPRCVALHHLDSVGGWISKLSRRASLPMLRTRPRGQTRTARSYAFIVVDVHHLLSAGLPGASQIVAMATPRINPIRDRAATLSRALAAATTRRTGWRCRGPLRGGSRWASFQWRPS